ncbi:MAG: hypothetical protein KDA42_17125, partial [Planctomycetales bacterium]|nr:hypothetical protein [Planctomycetales bacterium]
MNNNRKRWGRRGAILVWVAVLLPVLIGFVGLTVDVGYIFTDQANLQAFADVSALTGALYLPTETDAENHAAAVLTNNDASAGAALAAGDVEFGNWDP